MYAITENGYRAVTADMQLADNEERVEVLPESLLTTIRAAQVRAEVGQRLRSSDWTQMADAYLTESSVVAWADYRQNLRELPLHAEFPYVEWPEAPAE
ncbi:tail fiber assembly protein [Stenotrophomonas rhizophila]